MGQSWWSFHWENEKKSPNKARFPQTFLAALADLRLPEVDAMRPAGVLETTGQLPAVWRKATTGKEWVGRMIYEVSPKILNQWISPCTINIL
jgi:hypothetical protein